MLSNWYKDVGIAKFALFTIEEEKKKPLKTDSIGSDIPTCSGICTNGVTEGGLKSRGRLFLNMMNGFLPMTFGRCLVG